MKNNFQQGVSEYNMSKNQTIAETGTRKPQSIGLSFQLTDGQLKGVVHAFFYLCL